MSTDEISKNVARELKLTYYNNYLLKVGAISKIQHRLMSAEILRRTSVRKLIKDNATHKI